MSSRQENYLATVRNIRIAKKSPFWRIRIAAIYSGLSVIIFLALISAQVCGQTQVFVDDFNRANITLEAPTQYSITVTAGDGGAGINTNSFLELTNDTSAAANTNGIVYIYGYTHDFSSAYNQTLHSNSQIVVWNFNFKFNRATNPSGLDAGSYGTAIILAASDSIFAGLGAGNGYAVVYGNSGSPDPIRLVRFTGGIAGTVTNIVSSNNSDINAVNNYVSVRVRYDSNGDNWSLFIRDDGNINWSDPSTGILNQVGSTISDSIYTAIPLTHFGYYWAYSTANAQTSQFDNFRVVLDEVGIPTIIADKATLPSFGTISVGDTSSIQNISISGSNLNGNIIITPPIGFEIKTGVNSFSSNSITLAPINGTVEETIIDVRFSPADTGSFSGSITCTSTDAASRMIAVSGIGISEGLRLFITSDPFHADHDHAVLFAQAGMGEETVYGSDDWTYISPTLTFYVTPAGSQPICASEFEINWNASKMNLAATNGNIFNFFASQEISAGKIRINVGASSNLNETPSPGKYLARLDFAIIQPGYHEITITNPDFRFFNGEAQQNVQVMTDTGRVKFYLGDFASPANITTTGDGKINFDDLVQFALAYFSESDGEPAGYKSKFDIGPTNSIGGYFAMPNSDGQIQFEDLAIFSIGYGKTATLQLPKENLTPVIINTKAPLVKEENVIAIPLTISGGVKDIRALSLSLTYPISSLEYLASEKIGEINHEYCFLAAKPEAGTVTLDVAVIGAENEGLSQEGIFANVVFRQRCQSKDYDIKIQSAKVRNSNNEDIPIQLSSREVLAANIPTSFALAQNYPNPFNPITQIEYQLSRRMYVEISIFNILGEKISTLINEQQNAGYYRIEWNGRNTQHQQVASGIYFYKMRAVDPLSNYSQSFIAVKKMLLLK